ncbi:MAG TPA: hypothetical protein VGO50_10140 [Pyrinomonadaceae bacterium]|jgi:hypothetical protein|nr:hypothetical protein [Pyrinomonadaceae bacterium]
MPIAKQHLMLKMSQLKIVRIAIFTALILTFVVTAAAQKPVMWEPINTRQLDLYLGPGGNEMKPDLSSVTLLKEEKGGHNKKYRIKDGLGRTWVAKLGREAQPETAAVRLLWAIGYKTEINYLVPSITIPGKGTFQNVRLEARPDNVERTEEWKWKQNPFSGTNELQGLKILMVFLNNWDVLDLQNKVLESNGRSYYIVSDLGSTFGRLGNNNLPVIYRLGRSVNKPQHYIKSKFVKGVEDGEIELAYKGKNRGLFKGITVSQARWLANLMTKLSDKQIQDAFLAANYSQSDLSTLTTAVKNKIAELERASLKPNLAKK